MQQISLLRADPSGITVTCRDESANDRNLTRWPTGTVVGRTFQL
jgi:hypothetical protein